MLGTDKCQSDQAVFLFYFILLLFFLGSIDHVYLTCTNLGNYYIICTRRDQNVAPIHLQAYRPKHIDEQKRVKGHNDGGERSARLDCTLYPTLHIPYKKQERVQ